jgi:hypothetical protein
VPEDFRVEVEASHQMQEVMEYPALESQVMTPTVSPEEAEAVVVVVVTVGEEVVVVEDMELQQLLLTSTRFIQQPWYSLVYHVLSIPYEQGKFENFKL